MHIHHLTPPLSQRAGGLENAIEGMREALHLRGVTTSRHEFRLLKKYDLVHFHGLWQVQHRIAYLQCKKNKIPYVVSPHGMLEPYAWNHKKWKKAPYFRHFEKKSLQRAKAIFATSKMEHKNILQHISHPDIFVLPLASLEREKENYVAARKALNFQDDLRYLIFLSRIDPKKGMPLLLNSLLKLRTEEKRKCVLTIIGEGPAREIRALRKYCEQHKKELPCINWVGSLWGKERWTWLQASDLFCLPTKSENFGVAVLESLYVGTPVLTTWQTPWYEFVDREGFYICESSLSDTHKAIEKFLQTPCWTAQQRIALSQWSNAAFNWEALSRDYLKAYEQIVTR